MGIPGSMDSSEICDVITWFRQSEAWKFAGLCIIVRHIVIAWYWSNLIMSQDRVFNKNAPFAASFLEAVPRVLALEGRGKANSELFRLLIELQSMSLVLMALVLTAVRDVF